MKPLSLQTLLDTQIGSTKVYPNPHLNRDSETIKRPLTIGSTKQIPHFPKKCGELRTWEVATMSPGAHWDNTQITTPRMANVPFARAKK